MTGNFFLFEGRKNICVNFTAYTAFIDLFLFPSHTRALDTKGLKTIKNIPR